MKKSLFLLFLTPIFVLLLLEVFCFKPELSYLPFFVLTVLMAFVVKKMIGGSFFSWEYVATLGFPLMFIFFSAAYSMLTPLAVIRQAVFGLVMIFTFLYLRNISKEDKSVFIENIFSYAGFLLVFFAFSFFYGLRVFLGTSIVLLVCLIMGLVVLVILNVFWANRIAIKNSMIYIFLISLLMTQIAWSLYFLSLSYSYLGLILAMCYYMVIGVVKPYLRDSLTKKTVIVYLTCGVSGIMIVIFSAQWL